jgi:tRNA A37 N6-isopentenylltransferase MiaA
MRRDRAAADRDGPPDELPPGYHSSPVGAICGIVRHRMPLPPLLVIFGPTSSGKTALSLQLAAAAPSALGIEVEVVGADSRQVYVGMDIGTAKVSRAVMMRVPHHCLDLRPPDRKLSLVEYQAAALQRIQEIHARGRLPLLVGGTGTYVLSVAENWRVSEMRWPGPASVRREEKGPPLYRAAFIRPALSRAQILPRIDQGVERMFAAGLAEEVTSLAERYRLWEPGRMARNALAETHGYREFLAMAHRRGGSPRFRYSPRELQQIQAEIQQHTREYALRQWSWLKKMPPVQPVRNLDESLAVAKRLLVPVS